MSVEAASGGKEAKRQGFTTQTINVVAEAEDLPICWICLDGPQSDKPLIHPCRCPSFCHAACIARWQLQSAGTRRESYCDFCSCQLPDWKSILTPSGGAGAPAVMNVNFDNKTYSFQVSPGADGYKQFTEAIRKAFHLPEDSELNITFTCDEPSSGALLTLSGPGAYDAAVHCASVSAARRVSSLEQHNCISAAAAASGAGGGSSGAPTPQPSTPAGSAHPLSSHQLSRSNSMASGSDSSGSRRTSSSGTSESSFEDADRTSGSSSSSGSSVMGAPARHATTTTGGLDLVPGSVFEQEEEDGGSSSDSSASGGGGSRRAGSSSSGGSGRRGSGLGRKLRNAISDLLVIR